MNLGLRIIGNIRSLCPNRGSETEAGYCTSMFEGQCISFYNQCLRFHFTRTLAMMRRYDSVIEFTSSLQRASHLSRGLGSRGHCLQQRPSARRRRAGQSVHASQRDTRDGPVGYGVGNGVAENHQPTVAQGGAAAPSNTRRVSLLMIPSPPTKRCSTKLPRPSPLSLPDQL